MKDPNKTKYAQLLERQVEGIGQKETMPLDLSTLLMAMMFMPKDPKKDKDTGLTTNKVDPNADALALLERRKAGVGGADKMIEMIGPEIFKQILSRGTAGEEQGPRAQMGGLGMQTPFAPGGIPFSLGMNQQDPNFMAVLRMLGIIP